MTSQPSTPRLHQGLHSSNLDDSDQPPALPPSAIRFMLPSVQDHVILDARRAAYLPMQQSLLVSDLHWGKGETFRGAGIPVPDDVLLADLARLTALIQDYSPKRLVILGDLIHGKQGLTALLREKILQWRAGHVNLSMVLVAGNHDRAVSEPAAEWQIEVIQDDVEEAPYRFSHLPRKADGLFNWCGHIHPTVLIESRTDRLRLPCFHIQPWGATLPAFSEFTGGMNIAAGPQDAVFAIANGQVLPIRPQ